MIADLTHSLQNLNPRPQRWMPCDQSIRPPRRPTIRETHIKCVYGSNYTFNAECRVTNPLGHHAAQQYAKDT